MAGKALEVVDADRAARAARDVVEDDRDIDRVEHLLEVVVDALLIRLVVVRGDHEEPIDADLLELQGLVVALAGAVGASAADDGDRTSHMLDRELRDRDVLCVCHGRRLARRAQHEDAIRAIRHLELQDLVERGIVDRAVLIERGDQGDDGAGQLLQIHVNSYPRWAARPQDNNRQQRAALLATTCHIT